MSASQKVRTLSQVTVGNCSLECRTKFFLQCLNCLYLLHLEFDGTLQVFDLFIKVVSVSKQRREFASFVKTRSQKPGNLLDKRLGSQKCIVLLGELLDKFLLLVQLFQVVGAHVGNTRFLSLITMLLITKDADGEFWPWDMAQSTGKKLLQSQNVTTLKLLII